MALPLCHYVTCHEAEGVHAARCAWGEGPKAARARASRGAHEYVLQVGDVEEQRIPFFIKLLFLFTPSPVAYSPDSRHYS